VSSHLRERAAHFRRLASEITDSRTLTAIEELAAEYEALANEMEKQSLIQRRAYEMWEEQGHPDGLHAEHWHAAEQEITEGPKA
jgi:hypothetical protein